MEVLVVSEGGKGCRVGKKIYLEATSFILYISDFLKRIKGHSLLIKVKHQASLSGFCCQCREGDGWHLQVCSLASPSVLTCCFSPFKPIHHLLLFVLRGLVRCQETCSVIRALRDVAGNCQTFRACLLQKRENWPWKPMWHFLFKWTA